MKSVGEFVFFLVMLGAVVLCWVFVIKVVDEIIQEKYVVTSKEVLHLQCKEQNNKSWICKHLK